MAARGPAKVHSEIQFGDDYQLGPVVEPSVPVESRLPVPSEPSTAPHDGQVEENDGNLLRTGIRAVRSILLVQRLVKLFAGSDDAGAEQKRRARRRRKQDQQGTSEASKRAMRQDAAFVTS